MAVADVVDVGLRAEPHVPDARRRWWRRRCSRPNHCTCCRPRGPEPAGRRSIGVRSRTGRWRCALPPACSPTPGQHRRGRSCDASSAARGWPGRRRTWPPADRRCRSSSCCRWWARAGTSAGWSAGLVGRVVVVPRRRLPGGGRGGPGAGGGGRGGVDRRRGGGAGGRARGRELDDVEDDPVATRSPSPASPPTARPAVIAPTATTATASARSTRPRAVNPPNQDSMRVQPR